ncbi:MAG: acyl carrier protein [Bacteroidales bacterium]|nr:acyl carrier protein [Bacteroidales bacterium]
MTDLEGKLKMQVMEQLNMEDIEPDDIDINEPLFGEGIGLDSIDSLELIVLLEKEYGIKISDARMGKEVLFSISTMAKYIEKHQS